MHKRFPGATCETVKLWSSGDDAPLRKGMKRSGCSPKLCNMLSERLAER